jgi:hypothetical protein
MPKPNEPNQARKYETDTLLIQPAYFSLDPSKNTVNSEKEAQQNLHNKTGNKISSDLVLRIIERLKGI